MMKMTRCDVLDSKASVAQSQVNTGSLEKHVREQSTTVASVELDCAQTAPRPSTLNTEERNTNEECEGKAINGASGKRPRRLCPVEGCGNLVIHLPRHLRNLHKWSHQEAKYATLTHGLRQKRKTKENPKYKDYHRTQPCPVEGCPAKMKRIHKHLKTVHGISVANITKDLQDATRVNDFWLVHHEPTSMM